MTIRFPSRSGSTYAALLLVMAGMIFACANLSESISRGGPSLADARRARGEGRILESLDYAAEAVRLDPKLVAGWEFLRDTYERGVSDAVNDLTARDGSIDPSEAGRVAQDWGKLVALIAKVKKLPLPYRDPSGWNWNPTLKDYSPRYKAARKRAFDLYFNLGLAAIAQGEIDNAKKNFQIAVDTHADESSGERFQARVKAAAACIAFAQPLSQSFDISEVEDSVQAFRLALEFEPANAKAREGSRTTALRIADLYVAEGMSREYKGSDADLREAVRLYGQALVWNPEQSDALWLLPRAKENLADRAYQRGRKFEDASPVSEDALNAYREALGWVPGYRDAMPRVYLIPLRRESASSSAAVAPLLKGLPQLESRANGFIGKSPEASGSVDRLRTVSGRISSLQARTVTVLRRLAEQTEGTSLEPDTSRLNASFGAILTPMIGAGAAAGQGERILLAPFRDALSGMTSLSGKIAAGIPTALPSRVTKATGKIPDQAFYLRQEKDFEQALRISRELSQACPLVAAAATSLGTVFDSAEPVLTILSSARTDIVAAEALVDNLDRIIRELEALAQDLESAMRESISIVRGGKPMTLTVREALSDLPQEAKPYAAQFEDSAKRIVAPYLGRFAPAIPAEAPFRRIADLIERFPSLTATFSGSIMAGTQALQSLLRESDRAAGALNSMGLLLGSTL